MFNKKTVLTGITLITTLMLASPSFLSGIRELIFSGRDYRAAFIEIGSLISGEGEFPVFMSVRQEEKAAEPVKVPAPTKASAEVKPFEIRTLMGIREEIRATIPTAANNATEDLEADIKEIDHFAEAVAVFMESQAAFAEYEIPENVSCVAEPLPFDYEIPVLGRSSSGFGYRLHPIYKTVKYHYGTDIAVAKGTDIYAFADGTVILSQHDGGYGKYIVIEHDEGYETLYAHCSKILVSVGETVSKGQLVALVGSTGQVTGPHLHFELKCDGIYLNPEFYINSYA